MTDTINVPVTLEAVSIQADITIEGQRGIQGVAGPSAYEVAVANGFVGTEEEWLLSLAAGTIDLSDYLTTTHITNHPVPTTRDARNQVAGTYATGTGTASGTNTGDQDLSGKLNHTAGTLTDYKETTNYATTTGNVTIDLADGNVQRFILDAARQFTMPADPGALTESFVLIIECATFTPTWAASPVIEWLTSDGAAPTLVTTVNLVNVLTFIWDDVDTRWLGFLSGKETA